jgi:hypothetical protein
MDLKASAGALSLCGLLAVTGCPPLNQDPAARPDESEHPSSEDSVLVGGDDDAGTVQPAADLDPAMRPIQTWIDRIQRRDDLRSRLQLSLPAAPSTQSSRSDYADGMNALFTPGSSGAVADPEPYPTSQPALPMGPPESDNGPGTPEDLVTDAGPPLLLSIDARAANAPEPEPLPRRDVDPSVNAPATAARAPLNLDELIEQWLARPADPSFRKQLDRRLLQVLAGKYEDARQPLELASSTQQQMAGQMIETLIAIRETHGGDPGQEASHVLQHLERLEQSLVPLSDLRIPNLVLTRAVRGFGRYEAIDPPHFPTGHENELVVYCEIRNFVSRLTDDGRYESQFALRTTVLNRAGDTVLEINDEHIVDRCRARRHDCFIPRLIRLPATLSPGQYVVKVTIVDKIGEKVAEKRTTLRILARS